MYTVYTIREIKIIFEIIVYLVWRSFGGVIKLLNYASHFLFVDLFSAFVCHDTVLGLVGAFIGALETSVDHA